MPYSTRSPLYGQIESQRENNPLIVYATSHRYGAAGQFGADVIPELAKQIQAIPADKKAVDLMVISRGGDPNVAWRIITILRERFEKVNMLVPYEAYSAATLVALGADSIVMHPFANLGPVDPQLVVSKKAAIEGDAASGHISFGSEDLKYFLSFIKDDVNITDQSELFKAFDWMCKDVGAIPIGIAKRSQHLSQSMANKLLGLHMKEESKIKTIADALNKSFYHHGYPLGRKEAKEIGLPIEYPPPALEKLMWDVWIDLENEMQCKNPFDPIMAAMSDATVSQLLSSIQQIQWPAGITLQNLQQVTQTILQQVNMATIPSVNYKNVIGVVESKGTNSTYLNEGFIQLFRMADMRINGTMTVTSLKWS
jgi:hypothetical protein